MSHPVMSYWLAKCGMRKLKIQRAQTLAIEAYKAIHKMTQIYIQDIKVQY